MDRVSLPARRIDKFADRLQDKAELTLGRLAVSGL